jgi:hypothetical protein
MGAGPVDFRPAGSSCWQKREIHGLHGHLEDQHMRFMIIVKATADSEAGRFPDQPEAIFAAMGAFHEQLAKAGVLLDAAGLHPSSKGWRIRYDGDKRTVVDGPFAETKELVGGYTLIQVRGREEALEWSRRFPNPTGARCEIEVRQLYTQDEVLALLQSATLQAGRADATN